MNLQSVCVNKKKIGLCSSFLLFSSFQMTTKGKARLREPILRLRPLFVSLSISCPKNGQKNVNFQIEKIMNHSTGNI